MKIVRANKNAIFDSKFSKKCLKTPVLVYKDTIKRKFGENRVFLEIWESSESRFGRVDKNFITLSTISNCIFQKTTLYSVTCNTGFACEYSP